MLLPPLLYELGINKKVNLVLTCKWYQQIASVKVSVDLELSIESVYAHANHYDVNAMHAISLKDSPSELSL